MSIGVHPWLSPHSASSLSDPSPLDTLAGNSALPLALPAPRLLTFPRQSHRGAVWVGRQKHGRPWAVLTAICGRCSQVRLCGCFQTGFGPFSVREGLGRTRESVVRTTTRLVTIASGDKSLGHRRMSAGIESDFGFRISGFLRASDLDLRISLLASRPAGKDHICTTRKPFSVSSNSALRAGPTRGSWPSSTSPNPRSSPGAGNTSSRSRTSRPSNWRHWPTNGWTPLPTASRLGEQLRKVEAEIARRDVKDLTTAQLYTLARSLRRQIEQATV